MHMLLASMCHFAISHPYHITNTLQSHPNHNPIHLLPCKPFAKASPTCEVVTIPCVNLRQKDNLQNLISSVHIKLPLYSFAIRAIPFCVNATIIPCKLFSYFGLQFSMRESICIASPYDCLML